MTDLSISKGLFFEEFQVGQKGISTTRTVTEHDIMTFAGLSGDFNLIHVDAEFSKTTPFGQRIAHGLLGLSIASGLAVQTGVLGANVMAFREVGEWKFIKPIFIGDTVHVEMPPMFAVHFPNFMPSRFARNTVHSTTNVTGSAYRRDSASCGASNR